MPEMHFSVRWPDGSESRCYSPSLVVQQHVSEGEHYTLTDFLDRINTALTIASNRVQQKYGMPCSRAIGQMAQIRKRAAEFSDDASASVTITGFEI